MCERTYYRDEFTIPIFYEKSFGLGGQLLVLAENMKVVLGMKILNLTCYVYQIMLCLACKTVF